MVEVAEKLKHTVVEQGRGVYYGGFGFQERFGSFVQLEL